MQPNSNAPGSEGGTFLTPEQSRITLRLNFCPTIAVIREKMRFEMMYRRGHIEFTVASIEKTPDTDQEEDEYEMKGTAKIISPSGESDHNTYTFTANVTEFGEPGAEVCSNGEATLTPRSPAASK